MEFCTCWNYVLVGFVVRDGVLYFLDLCTCWNFASVGILTECDVDDTDGRMVEW